MKLIIELDLGRADWSTVERKVGDSELAMARRYIDAALAELDRNKSIRELVMQNQHAVVGRVRLEG